MTMLDGTNHVCLSFMEFLRQLSRHLGRGLEGKWPESHLRMFGMGLTPSWRRCCPTLPYWSIKGYIHCHPGLGSFFWTCWEYTLTGKEVRARQGTEANGRGALSDWPCALKNSFHIFHLPRPCPAQMALKMGSVQFSYVKRWEVTAALVECSRCLMNIADVANYKEPN
jgi:hypothetical protein